MQINLTIEQYAHLRAIYELEGNCDKGNLICERCPLHLGRIYEGHHYGQYKCVEDNIKVTIALSILKADEDVCKMIVEEKV